MTCFICGDLTPYRDLCSRCYNNEQMARKIYLDDKIYRDNQINLDHFKVFMPKNTQEGAVITTDTIDSDNAITTVLEIQLLNRALTNQQQVELTEAVNVLVNHFIKRQPGDPEPAFSEEEIMGFGKMKKGKNLPDHIKDLNFSDLANSQVYVLADFLGIKHRVTNVKTEEARDILKQECLKQLDRAQIGYEVIGLQRTSQKTDTPSDKRALELLTGVLNTHMDALDSNAELAVRKHAGDIMDKLQGFAKKAIADAAEKARPIVIETEGKRRKVKGVLPPEFERMVQLASQRVPILLVGPAGCGKTYLCEKLAEALNMEFSDQSCSEGMSESVFNGLLLPIGKSGEFKHVSSPFMERYETGGIMLLDELDAGDPNLFTYINKAIANSSYTAAQRYEKPVVKKHRDFVLVAAANTFGHGADSMYVGRNQLDAATLDRFKVGLITMDYSQDVELSLADEDLCTWAWGIRKKIRDNKLRRVMSTRVIENLAKMTAAYKWKQKDWEAAYFTGWSDADRRAVA